MQGFWTVILLIISNIFMTFAWYGQLKLSETHRIDHWPLIAIILVSWLIALFEYLAMVPANRIGSNINGGPFNLMQLKIIQECVSLTVFTLICAFVFKSQPIHWNHIVAFVLILGAVFFCFLDKK